MIRDDLVRAHRARSLNPDRPVLRGTAQNPDVYFQARETVNPFYDACPDIVQRAMDRFAALTGRQYRLFDYFGAPDAERVVVLMGSSALAAEECVERLRARGEKVGLLNVHLFRPFSAKAFVDALPRTVRAIAVLDRTKEPGSAGEPLYQDVVTALHEAGGFRSVAARDRGRYGLASKEFTPAMCAAVFAELATAQPAQSFRRGHQRRRVASQPGITTPHSPPKIRKPCAPSSTGWARTEPSGANKNSIKIIGEDTDNYAQGYFVYDSKKSGAMTISHLRFGRKPIRASYLISRASFVACHQFSFLERMDVLQLAEPGATFLLNSPFRPGRSLGPSAAIGAARRSSKSGCASYVIDAYQRGQG